VPALGSVIIAASRWPIRWPIDGARSTLQEALRVSQRIGDNRSMAEARGQAYLDGDLGDWHRAVMLHGAAQALLDQTGVPWDPFGGVTARKSSTRPARPRAMSSLQRAYARGMTLSFDLALEGTPPGT